MYMHVLLTGQVLLVAVPMLLNMMFPCATHPACGVPSMLLLQLEQQLAAEHPNLNRAATIAQQQAPQLLPLVLLLQQPAADEAAARTLLQQLEEAVRQLALASAGTRLAPGHSALADLLQLYMRTQVGS
jgi:hypothetical protein